MIDNDSIITDLEIKHWDISSDSLSIQQPLFAHLKSLKIEYFEDLDLIMLLNQMKNLRYLKITYFDEYSLQQHLTDCCNVLSKFKHLRTFEIVAMWENLSIYISEFIEKIISTAKNSINLIFQSDLALKQVLEL